MKAISTEGVGVRLDSPAEVDQVPPVVRILGLRSLVVDPGRDAIEELAELVVEDVVAVDAGVPVGRRLVAAVGAGHRRDGLFGVVGIRDLDAVQLGELLFLGLPGELRDVPRDDRRPPGATLSVLDERLGLLPLGQPVGVGLAEVGRRDRAIDASPLGRLPEALQELLVTDALGRVQLRPQVVLAPAGVVRQPLLDVGDGLDQVDVVLPALPVDADLHGVFAVGDVADAHVVEFAAAKATLELEVDQRRVAIVARRLDHGLDVVLEAEHVGLVGLGLVVPRGLRRDPVVRVRDLVVAGDVLPEESERDAVVPVGLLGAVLDVVGVVNPADDRLGGVLRLVERLVVVRIAVEFLDERVVQAGVGVLAHATAVPQELLVSVVTVVLPEQSEFVAEVQEKLSVAVASAALAVFELGTQGLHSSFRIPSHEHSVGSWDGKPLVESPPPAHNKRLTIPCQDGPELPSETSSRKDISYNSLYNSPGSAGCQGAVA